MANSRKAKIQADIVKAKTKLAEQQARVRELETKYTEAVNTEIVDIVRGLNIPLDNLAEVLRSLKSTSGQVDPKSKTKIITDKEDETE
jgi:hypothetical protein